MPAALAMRLSAALEAACPGLQLGLLSSRQAGGCGYDPLRCRPGDSTLEAQATAEIAARASRLPGWLAPTVLWRWSNGMVLGPLWSGRRDWNDFGEALLFGKFNPMRATERMRLSPHRSLLAIQAASLCGRPVQYGIRLWRKLKKKFAPRSTRRSICTRIGYFDDASGGGLHRARQPPRRLEPIVGQRRQAKVGQDVIERCALEERGEMAQDVVVGLSQFEPAQQIVAELVFARQRTGDPRRPAEAMEPRSSSAGRGPCGPPGETFRGCSLPRRQNRETAC